jgi:hypothetical protein
MLFCRRIKHDEVAFLCADAHIHLSIRPDRDTTRIHLARVHAAQVLHLAGLGIIADQLRLRIGAGVKLAVLAQVVLPEVIFAGRGFADDFDSLAWFPRIEAQDQPSVPGAKVDSLVRPGDERPGSRAFRRIELTRFARVGIHLHEEQLPAELIEVEIERLATAAVRADDATHQPAHADRDAQRLKPGGRYRAHGWDRKKRETERAKFHFHRTRWW